MISKEGVMIESISDYDKLENILSYDKVNLHMIECVTELNTYPKDSEDFEILNNEVLFLQNKLLLLKDLDYESIKEIISSIGGEKCNLIIEYPYLEKDYLSTYYSFYSGKYKNYSKYNARVHFFSKNELYVGFITLRPGIPGQNIGRSLLTPDFFLEKNYHILTGDYKFHYLDYEDYVNCFPWMRQETDISVCSHVCLWSIVKYFSKFPQYADTTMNEIIETVNNCEGRKIPSMGLEVKQVANVLEAYHLSPLILGGIGYDEKNINSLIGYLESGLPIIGFIKNKLHAVVIIGRADITKELDNGQIDFKNKDKFDRLYNDNDKKYIMFSELVDEIIVSDDNFISPYRKVWQLKAEDIKATVNTQNNGNYGFREIEHFIVPLYKKMHYTFSAVQKRLDVLFNSNPAAPKDEKFNFPEKPIVKIYLSTSNSLKQHMIKHCECEELNKIINFMSLPRFIWNIDLCTVEDYKDNNTTCKIIIDSTAFTHETDPWLLIHDDKKIKYFDNEINTFQSYELNHRIKPYKLFNNMYVTKDIY